MAGGAIPEDSVTLDSLRETARRAYGTDALGYAKGRPDYPEQVFRVLRDRCGLRDGAVVLECGPGTGLVTQRLVANGASVLAVEPDPAMAEFLARAMRGSDVEIAVVTFERATLPDDHFDLAVAATSFHWVDQEIGVPKLGRAVRPGGWVALWWTIFHDPDREDPFRQATRHLLGGADPDGQRRRASFQLDTVQRRRDLHVLGGLDEVSSQVLHWTARFDTPRLRAFYGSLIELRRRSGSEQRALLDAIEGVARNDFEGDVTRPFVTVLSVRWPDSSVAQAGVLPSLRTVELTATSSTVERIGVRELRQQASRYLDRVATGETIEVTVRGRPVALLVPTPGDRWQDLIAGGQVLAAASEGDVVDDPPADYGIDASARLAGMRDDAR